MEIFMKKKSLSKVLTIAVTGTLLSGCGYFAQFENFENSTKLRVGMTKEQVRQIMGEPVNEVYCKPDLWFYYINTQWHDGLITRDECMPLVFRDGKLAGWGNEYYNRVVLAEPYYKMPEIKGVGAQKNSKAVTGKKAAVKKVSVDIAGDDNADHPDINQVD